MKDKLISNIFQDAYTLGIYVENYVKEFELDKPLKNKRSFFIKIKEIFSKNHSDYLVKEEDVLDIQKIIESTKDFPKPVAKNHYFSRHSIYSGNV